MSPDVGAAIVAWPTSPDVAGLPVVVYTPTTSATRSVQMLIRSEVPIGMHAVAANVPNPWLAGRATGGGISSSYDYVGYD